jgi:HemY protein
MRLILVVIGALLVGILTALTALKDPGYVLIARAPWSAEMTLPVFLLLALAGSGLFFLIVYLIVLLVRIPQNVARWRMNRNLRQSREALYQGLIKLAESDWVEAESQLLASMRGAEKPLLSYLGAACANQGQGNLEKRDEYLAAAQRSSPPHHLAVGMTQATLQYISHQSERALATLTDLRQTAPRHKHVLKLLAQLYLELRDWTNLANLIPQLRQENVMTAREVDALELRAHRELLTLSLPSGSLEPLQKAWSSVPKSLRRDPAFIAIYARHLIQQREMEAAESLLRQAIETEWDDTLVELYGLAHGERAAEQLEAAEAWLALYPENAKLLLTLGRLAINGRQDQQACGYLEKCISLRGPIDAYRELGTVLERMGEKDRALVYFRRGTELYADESRLMPPTRPGVSFVPRKRAIH